MEWFKRNRWLALSWSITILCLLVTIHAGGSTRVCTHIMNINDGLYESDAALIQRTERTIWRIYVL